jgi:hypothetical protein
MQHSISQGAHVVLQSGPRHSFFSQKGGTWCFGYGYNIIDSGVFSKIENICFRCEDLDNAHKFLKSWWWYEEYPALRIITFGVHESNWRIGRMARLRVKTAWSWAANQAHIKRA